MSVVVQQVNSDQFVGQRALIIGGSRGLGEVAAKILAAGGADVHLTYASGREDALVVAADIGRWRSTPHVLRFDAVDKNSHIEPGEDVRWCPTHVYFFATPSIQFGSRRRWDQALFERYCAFYVHGLARSVEQISILADPTKQPVTVFWPSTEYIDQPPPGGAEYVAAKAAGEGLVVALRRLRPHWRFVSPRLPRLLTDQTSYGTSKTGDALAYLLPLIRGL
ncbi:MAG: SDR family NAD(P)-dependent oxidoreductase [Chloroflexi bacterium]|nr:SDR family NAD(P)-dependent oxidoreductase [Chloroflexota bacterium]